MTLHGCSSACVGLASVLSLLVAWGCTRPTATEGSPCRGCNLILMSMDTLRADHLGAYGYDRPTTPNLDALARESVVFRDAISQSAWTRPAHLSMFTGLYPRQHGVVTTGNGVAPADSIPTLASVLASRGYQTAAFTGGANMSTHYGMNHGFGSYDTTSEHLTHNVGTALGWLGQHGKKPFFLFVHGYEPHNPYRSTPEDRAALGLGAGPPRDFGRRCKKAKAPDDLAAYVGEYDGAVRKGDRAVGRFLDGLRTLGLLDRTVVLFTSDHGEEIFDHGACYHVRTLYQELLRVPLLVRVPGVVPRQIEGVVPASIAIAPTALALIGFDDSPLPGPSLAGAILRGEKPAFAYVASETGSVSDGPLYQHTLALTGNDDKLIHWLGADRYELFDLDTDPHERTAVTDPAREEKLARALESWAKEHSLVAEPRPVRGLPQRVQRRLRALGYVQ